MKPTNMPHRVKAKRERALGYWKAQLDPKTRSEKCDSSMEYIKGQIASLEKKLEGAKS